LTLLKLLDAFSLSSHNPASFLFLHTIQHHVITFMVLSFFFFQIHIELSVKDLASQHWAIPFLTSSPFFFLHQHLTDKMIIHLSTFQSEIKVTCNKGLWFCVMPPPLPKKLVNNTAILTKS
jgi:hypothetical protein